METLYVKSLILTFTCRDCPEVLLFVFKIMMIHKDQVTAGVSSLKKADKMIEADMKEVWRRGSERIFKKQKEDGKLVLVMGRSTVWDGTTSQLYS